MNQHAHTPRLTVGKSLSLGFALVILLGIAIAAIAGWRLSQVNGEVKGLVEDSVVKLEWASRIKDNMNVQTRTVSKMALTTDDSARRAEKKIIDTVRADTGALFKKFQDAMDAGEERQIMEKALAARNNYNAVVNKAIDYSLAGQLDLARDVILQDADTANTEIFNALNALQELQQTEVRRAGASVQAITTNTSIVLLIIAFVATLLGIGTGWALTRSILRQLGGEPAYASSIAREIAEGNLAVAVQVRPGDTSSLLATMAAMRQSLAQVVDRVRHGSESVAAASSQIAQGNYDLSGRTEQQASALQETAASMEELNSTVKQNADNAQQANQLAQNAADVAARGGEVVARVVETMNGISVASKKIADIIGVIDGIAFQTNILALNAAVEAARAGEQGRGFAVVAGEVRSLAGRAADASKEIGRLITDSVEQVEQGSVLVGQAGETMQEVVTGIRQVHDIMSEISAASTEQSTGVSQVGDAVTQMDQTTQQNAALVEEMSAAASSLNTQAQQLLQAVSVFKLDAAALGGAAARAVDAPAGANPSTAVAATPVAKPVSKAGARAGSKATGAQRQLGKSQPAAQPRPAAQVALTAEDDWESF